MWRRFYAGVVLTFAVGILAVIFRIGEDTPTLQEMFPTGAIRIGVDASNPPFAYPTDDGLEGLEIELGELIGEEIGLPVQFINIGFDGLYDALINEPPVVDILISQLIINPMRSADVFYTTPYFNAGLVLVSDATRPIITMHDVAGQSLAIEFGSSADNEARLWSRRISAFEVMPYELPQYALDSVRLGAAEVALVDSTTAYLYRSAHPEWQPSITHVTDVLYAIAVRVHDIEKARLVNDTVNHLLEEEIIEQLIENGL